MKYNLPPITSHRRVKEAPSANGPTTDFSGAPDSSITIICWGGTEKENEIINFIKVNIILKC